MRSQSILLSICAQALLTLAVWLWMYYTRLSTMYRKKIDPQDLANEARALTLLKDVVNPSDNLENLFELPVLFYTATLLIFVTGLTDSFYIDAAWGFVAFRALHSFIHVSSNRIVYRFSAYVLSSLLLWAMWIRLTVQLIKVHNII